MPPYEAAQNPMARFKDISKSKTTNTEITKTQTFDSGA